jgi:hypothetical protein
MHVGPGQASAGDTLKPRRMTIQLVIEKGSKVQREEAPPRYGVILGGVQRLVSGPSRLESGRHPMAASQVVTNPRIAAGSTVVSDWLPLFRCTEDKNIMKT